MEASTISSVLADRTTGDLSYVFPVLGKKHRYKQHKYDFESVCTIVAEINKIGIKKIK